MTIIEGTIVAIPIPGDSASGCAEWQLIDWTLADDEWPALPVLDDGEGDEDPKAWGSDYAIRAPGEDDWRFPDGERCSDEDLRAAFVRRSGRQ